MNGNVNFIGNVKNNFSRANKVNSQLIKELRTIISDPKKMDANQRNETVRKIMNIVKKLSENKVELTKEEKDRIVYYLKGKIVVDLMENSSFPDLFYAFICRYMVNQSNKNIMKINELKQLGLTINNFDDLVNVIGEFYPDVIKHKIEDLSSYRMFKIRVVDSFDNSEKELEDGTDIKIYEKLKSLKKLSQAQFNFLFGELSKQLKIEIKSFDDYMNLLMGIYPNIVKSFYEYEAKAEKLNANMEESSEESKKM